MSALGLLNRLRDKSYNIGGGSRDQAADVIEECLTALLKWKFAWQYMPDSIAVQATDTLWDARENGERVLKKYLEIYRVAAGAPDAE